MLPPVCIFSSLLKPAGYQPGSIMLPLSKPACEIGTSMLEPLLSALNSTQSCLTCTNRKIIKWKLYFAGWLSKKLDYKRKRRTRPAGAPVRISVWACFHSWSPDKVHFTPLAFSITVNRYTQCPPRPRFPQNMTSLKDFTMLENQQL